MKKVGVIFIFILFYCPKDIYGQKRSHWIPMLRSQIAIKKGDKRDKAETYADRAADRFIQKKQREGIIASIYCNNLGYAYAELKKYDKAMKWYNKSLEINEDFIIPHLNISRLYTQKKDFDRALKAQKKGLELCEKFLKKNHKQTAFTNYQLSLIYQELGDAEKASEFNEKALFISKNRLNKFNQMSLSLDFTHSDLSQIYVVQKEYEKALELEEKGLYILQNKKVKNDEQIRNSHRNIALLYENLGDFQKANSSWNIAIELDFKQINNIFLYLTEEQRLSYLGKTIDHTDFYSYSATCGNEDTKQLAAKLLLNSKSIVLGYNMSIREFSREIQDTTLNKQINHWNWLCKELIVADLIPKRQRTRMHLDIDELNQEKEKIEIDILQHPQLKSKLNSKTIAWRDIQNHLTSDEATIDFLRIYEKQDSLWAYYGIVISKDLSSPQFVRLTDDTLSEYLTTDTLTGKPYYLSDENKPYELYKKIWQPLEPYLEGITKVHLSPSGALHQLSFESLEYNGTEGYLAERYEFRYHSALRDMLKPKDDTSDYQDIVLGGNVIYDLDQQGAQRKNEEEVLGIATVNRGSRNGFGYLPHTLNEIVEVHKIAEKSGLNTTFLTGKAVTEDTVRHFSGKYAPSILHWATHGDFLTRSDSMPDHSRIGSYYSLSYSDNPLQRSLLAFYGANYRWKQNERTLYSDDDDGILTALEVTTLDLQNTDLVVLSACSTGLGQTDDTEGVFGLQRAFKLAGVNHVVASLWNVNDEATKDLMVRFYKNLLQQKQDPATALRNAKNYFMKNGTEPERWAGFILIE